MTSSAALLMIGDVFIKRQAVVQLIIEVEVACSSIEIHALYTFCALLDTQEGI